ncbi:hypothetical protein SAY86_005786 [Trapa natans]|uniref:PTM/DIR17-like Tudor domain-containing protein n=1 Tax=Trapa natans TaxID=22666 RepID=A0AAN7L683_TRANT|nr:hypothetical protein SAY86_005786 [Trapa natans]
MASISSSAMVYHLPGEPAVVINGVPGSVPEDEPPGPSDPTVEAAAAAMPRANPGLGGWMEGRGVQKLFEGQLYTGTIAEFDKEAGWYRVVYEDGDFEDLEWHELQEVIVPFDIEIPLKSLALRVLRKTQKTEDKSSEDTTTPQIPKKRGRPKGFKNNPKTIEEAAKESGFPRDDQPSNRKV